MALIRTFASEERASAFLSSVDSFGLVLSVIVLQRQPLTSDNIPNALDYPLYASTDSSMIDLGSSMVRKATKAPARSCLALSRR